MIADSTPDSPDSSRVLAAMPAYNEGRYVGSMVIRALEHVDNVLVVDDGSTDDTARIAHAAGADVVRHSRNEGYGSAIRTIFRAARQRGIDCLVILDADNQHDARDIPCTTEPVLQGIFDVVVGHREPRQMPGYRVVGQKVLSLFTTLISGSRVSDTQSGFRAFSRRAIAELEPVLKQNGMAISSEITAEATRLGLRVTEIPIRVKYDGDGSTHNPIAQGAHTLTRIMTMISEQRPLLFFSLVGLLSLAGGFAVGLRSYSLLLATGVPPVGTMLVSMLLVVIGVLSLFTGIILHVITRDRIGREKYGGGKSGE